MRLNSNIFKPKRNIGSSDPSRERISALLILIIFLVSFAVYSNTLLNGFVSDDTDQVLKNQWIRDVKYMPDIFSKSVWSFQKDIKIFNQYRPMIHVIYMLNYHLFGLSPWGFHLVNILIHACVSVLVFIILERLLRLSSLFSGRDEKGIDSELLSPPFIGAVLFAVHPIHTELVAWVAEVHDLSYTFFTLLSLYLYMRFEEGTKRMYSLSVVSFSIATLCKEPALILPVILVAYDYIFGKIQMKRYMPYLMVVGVYLGLRYNALGGFSPQESYVKLSSYGYIINVFPLFIQYLEKLFLPINLSFYHVLHPISSIFEMKGLVSLAVTTVFAIAIFVSFRKRSILGFSLLLILLPLLPVLYIPAVGPSTFSERQLYLPSFGFVLLIVLALSFAKAFSHRLSFWMVLISLTLAVVYSADTVSRNVVWRDDLTLFADTVRKSPDVAVLHNKLGIEYLQKNRPDEAANEFIAALKLNPDFADAHYNLGIAYEKEIRFDEAANEFIAVLMLNPDDAEANYELEKCYERIEKTAVSQLSGKNRG